MKEGAKSWGQQTERIQEGRNPVRFMLLKIIPAAMWRIGCRWKELKVWTLLQLPTLRGTQYRILLIENDQFWYYLQSAIVNNNYTY